MKDRYLAYILIMAMLFSLGGCGSRGGATYTAKDTVLTYAGEDITLGEVYLYAATVIEDYEQSYGRGVWSWDVSVTRDSSLNMEDITRRDIIEDITHVKLLSRKSGDYKIALTDEEMQRVASETDAFYEELTDRQIADMELDYDMVHRVMQENALARKVYDYLVDEAGIEVSDEAARETTFYDMYFECYAVASSGDVTRFSEDERQSQYERALQAYSTLINPIESTFNDGTKSGGTGSTNIEGLAEYYGLHNSSYYTMTPSEIEGIYGKDIKDSMYNLEDGSYSLVTESEYGYHIFYMKALTDREATDRRKDEMIVSKRRSYMEELYSEWQSALAPDYSYESSVNFDTYDKISFIEEE